MTRRMKGMCRVVFSWMSHYKLPKEIGKKGACLNTCYKTGVSWSGGRGAFSGWGGGVQMAG